MCLRAAAIPRLVFLTPTPSTSGARPTPSLCEKSLDSEIERGQSARVNSNETLFCQKDRRLSWKVFPGALCTLLWVLAATQSACAATLNSDPATDWPGWRGL